MLKTLLRKKYLRWISGVKQEKFEKCVSKLKSAWRAAQKRKRVAGRPYGIVDLREHLLLLLMYYRTYTTHLFLAQIFKVDEATICRAIRRIAPLAERILKIKPECLLGNVLQFWEIFCKKSLKLPQNFLVIVQQLVGLFPPKPSAGVSPPAPSELLYELQYYCNS